MKNIAKKIYDRYVKSPKSWAMPKRLNDSYDLLTTEIYEQFKTIHRSIQVSFVNENPYKTSKELFEDIDSGHLKVYKTNPKDKTVLPANHPMMKYKKGLLINDIFRAVHDYFGHYLELNSFNPLRGETRAYLAHKKTLSEKSIPALMRETILQSLVFAHSKCFSNGKSFNDFTEINENELNFLLQSD